MPPEMEVRETSGWRSWFADDEEVDEAEGRGRRARMARMAASIEVDIA